MENTISPMTNTLKELVTGWNPFHPLIDWLRISSQLHRLMRKASYLAVCGNSLFIPSNLIDVEQLTFQRQ